MSSSSTAVPNVVRIVDLQRLVRVREEEVEREGRHQRGDRTGAGTSRGGSQHDHEHEHQRNVR